MSFSKKRTYSQAETSNDWFKSYCEVLDQGRVATKIFAYLVSLNTYGNIAYIKPAEIAKDLKMQLPNVSAALKKLVECEAVRIYFDKRGNRAGYRINPFIFVKIPDNGNLAEIQKMWTKYI